MKTIIVNCHSFLPFHLLNIHSFLPPTFLVFPTEPPGVVCPPVTEKAFQLASGSILEITLGALLCLAIVIIVVIVCNRKKKSCCNTKKDEESQVIIKAQYEDKIGDDMGDKATQMNSHGVKCDHPTNTFREMKDSFFTPLQET